MNIDGFIDSLPTDEYADLAEEIGDRYQEIEDEDVSGLAMSDDDIMSATRRFIMSQFSDGEGSVEEFRMKNEITGRQFLADMAKREMDYINGPSLSGKDETEA